MKITKLCSIMFKGTYSNETRRSKCTLPGHMQPQSISSVDNAADRTKSISGERNRSRALHEGRGVTESPYGMKEGRGRTKSVGEGRGRVESPYGVRRGRGRAELAQGGRGRAESPYGVREGRDRTKSVREGQGRVESFNETRDQRGRIGTTPEGMEKSSHYGLSGECNLVGTASEGRGRADSHYGVRRRGGVRGGGRGRARGRGGVNPPDSPVGQVKTSGLDPIVDHDLTSDPGPPSLVPPPGLLLPPPPPSVQEIRPSPPAKEAQFDRPVTTREAACQNTSRRGNTRSLQKTSSAGMEMKSSNTVTGHLR